jgi:hypothetical protein
MGVLADCFWKDRGAARAERSPGVPEERDEALKKRTRTMKKMLLSAAVLSGIVSWSPVAAQSCAGVASCQVTTTAAVTVPALVALDVSGAGSVALTAPGADDFETGYVQDAGPSMTVKANRAWTLSVHTTNATNWTYAGDQGGVKPIGDLTWSTTANGTYAAITTSAAPVASGARTNGASPEVHFRTLYSSDFGADNNAAGSYSIALVFTVAAP